MTTEQHAEIVLLLNAILASLERRPQSSPSSAQSRPANAPQSQPAGQQAEIPQPAQVVADAGACVVHFGKNQGKRLDELGERSVEW